MDRLARCLSAFVLSAVFFGSTTISAGTSAAQPRTPCDQLVDRLGEIQLQEAQLRDEYATAAGMVGSTEIGPMLDRLGGVLADTEALLLRIDECSRSPVPSMAD